VVAVAVQTMATGLAGAALEVIVLPCKANHQVVVRRPKAFF